MVRKFIRACLFAALGLFAVALSFGTAATPISPNNDDKVPDISEIMNKGHKGADSYMSLIRKAAKSEQWGDAQKYAKSLAVFGECLGKNKPPKGDAESWKTLTEKYAAATKAVFKATEDKNAKAVNAALGTIDCKGCHSKHR
jgi:cytochrome c556